MASGSESVATEGGALIVTGVSRVAVAPVPSRTVTETVDIPVTVAVPARLTPVASVVIVSISQSSDEAQRTSFVHSGRVLVEAAMRYRFYTGEWPEDSGSGDVPSGLEDYIVESQWTLGPPIGGVWDQEYNSFGLVSAVGVHFDGTGETRDDAYMVNIDAMIDDGDLSTGGFQKLAADRYYFVIAD